MKNEEKSQKTQKDELILKRSFYEVIIFLCFHYPFSVKNFVKKQERNDYMARRGENIYKRRDGRWEGRFIQSYSDDGKAKYKSVYAKTYKDVKSKLLDAKEVFEEKNRKDETSKKVLFESWLDEWLNAKKTNVKESTFIRYRNSIENHIKPNLGKYSIEEIDYSTMESFVSHLSLAGKLNDKVGLSPKTINDLLTITKETFKYAQNHGVEIKCNFNGLSAKKHNTDMRVLNKSETKQLVDYLNSDLDIYKSGVLLCLFTGIRIGELCALKWKNISLENKTIKVEETMQRIQKLNSSEDAKTKIIITAPKSFTSTRIIPIPDFVVEILKCYKKDSDSYFLSEKNKTMIEPRTMQNKFQKYIKECGIPKANFHSLRHTFATRCVELGFDIKSLSEILGHSSVKITLDKYVHCSMDLKRMNMSKLQCAFG